MNQPVSLPVHPVTKLKGQQQLLPPPQLLVELMALGLITQPALKECAQLLSRIQQPFANQQIPGAKPELIAPQHRLTHLQHVNSIAILEVTYMEATKLHVTLMAIGPLPTTSLTVEDAFIASGGRRCSARGMAPDKVAWTKLVPAQREMIILDFVIATGTTSLIKGNQDLIAVMGESTATRSVGV